jgi:ADP-heptose:LPS heptosyltransferase
LWTAQQWADLANTISNRSGLPVYFIGAEFDAAVMREIQKHNPRVGLIIQPPAAQLFWLLKNASAFVGYQSGLSILADNFNTRQLIVYFHTLRNMRDSWVKPQNRNDLFRFCYFDDGPEHAAAMVC